MLNTAVFVSGRGSNLKAILDNIPENLSGVKVEAVISNRDDCPAGKLAGDNGIDLYFVAEKQKEGYVQWDELIKILSGKKIGLVILAGFLKKIPDIFVDAFEGKIINIHPALLPSFGGKGMYGMNVHTAVFEKSCQVSGPTVHFVDKIYDNGKIIAQRCVDISSARSPEDVARMVLAKEHELLPYVVRKFSEGKIKEIGNRIIIE